MPVYDQRIVRLPAGTIDPVVRRIAAEGDGAIGGHGGRLFGVFKGLIGLSVNTAVVVSEWPDAASASSHGGLLIEGIDGAALVDHDIWEPTSRPMPGERPVETGGYYSHRAFDMMEGDWPRFLELTEAAWGDWEGAHAARVAGFWKCRNRPAPGEVRIRLMAWYESLDAWERSRWFNANAKPSPEAYARFRERSLLLTDTQVSILTRLDGPV